MRRISVRFSGLWYYPPGTKPYTPKVDSPASIISTFEKWEKVNRLNFDAYQVESDTIRVSIPNNGNTKDFIDAIGKRLKNLISLTYKLD